MQAARLTRTGFGFDSHLFASDGTLVLGGIKFTGVPALRGHSDGDALLHAVIDALHAGGEISANEISRWLRTDKAWVGRSVDRLIRAGYARRRADPGHGRRQLLSLTAKGERAYTAIATAARRRNDNLLASLSGEERKVLERALAKLQAKASAMLAVPEHGFGLE